MKRSLAALMVLAALVLGACGSNGSDEGAQSPTSAASTGDCPPASPAMAEAPALPDGFPAPDGVTFTSSKTAGPSTIVEGYYAGDLDAIFEAYKDGFTSASYDVTRSENEGDDAEVNWSGGGTTGEVKLNTDPGCEGRTLVKLTIRPD
jgi:hypothetical protein